MTKKAKYVPIYTLRTKCDECHLDTARTFVLKDGENPTEAFTQLENWARKRWPKDHPKCVHRVEFRWMTDKEYKYDTNKHKAVAR